MLILALSLYKLSYECQKTANGEIHQFKHWVSIELFIWEEYWEERVESAEFQWGVSEKETNEVEISDWLVFGGAQITQPREDDPDVRGAAQTEQVKRGEEPTFIQGALRVGVIVQASKTVIRSLPEIENTS